MKGAIVEWLVVNRYKVDQLWFKLTCLVLDSVTTGLILWFFPSWFWINLFVGAPFIALDVYVIQKDRTLHEYKWRAGIALRLWQMIDKSLFRCAQIALDIDKSLFHKTELTAHEVALSESVGRRPRKRK